MLLTTSTDNVGIGGASLGKLSVDGDTDEIQLLIQGNGTQTSNLAVFENSSGTDLVTISNTGLLTSNSWSDNTNTISTFGGRTTFRKASAGVTEFVVSPSGSQAYDTAVLKISGSDYGADQTNNWGMLFDNFGSNGATGFTLSNMANAGLLTMSNSGSTTGYHDFVLGIQNGTGAESAVVEGIRLDSAATPAVDFFVDKVIITSGTGNISTTGDIAVNGGDVTSTSTLNLTSATSSAITLDSGTTGTINIGTGASGKSINIGTDNSNADTIGIGSALDTLSIAATTFTTTLTTTSSAAFASSTTNSDVIAIKPQSGTATTTYTGTITSADLTAARTWTLPDATGTIALTSDIAGAFGWTDGGTDVTLTTSTDNVGIGGASLGKLSVDGDTDEIQLLVQGNGTQTSNLAVFENSSGTDLVTISNAGLLTSNSWSDNTNTISTFGGRTTFRKASAGVTEFVVSPSGTQSWDTAVLKISGSDYGADQTNQWGMLFDNFGSSGAGGFSLTNMAYAGLLTMSNSGGTTGYHDLVFGVQNGTGAESAVVEGIRLDSAATPAVNFFVDKVIITSGTGDISTTGDIAVNGGDVTSTGALNVTSATSNALTLDSGTTGTVNIGTGTSGKTINIGTSNSNADTIAIGSALDTLSISSSAFAVSTAGVASGLTGLTSTGNLTFTGANITGASPLVFDGATADAVKTTFAITDPILISKIITFPNATGTVALTSDLAIAGGSSRRRNRHNAHNLNR